MLPPPPDPGASRYFEPNLGQYHQQVKFRAKAGQYWVNFYDDGFELESVVSKKASETPEEDVSISCLDRLGECLYERPDYRQISAKIAFKAARQNPVPGSVSSGVTNYYLPHGQFSGVPRYESIRYEDLYDGIDLIFRFNSDALLEFDLEMDPGVGPDAFGLLALGNSEFEIESDGAVTVQTDAGFYRKSKPVLIGDDPMPGAHFDLQGNSLGIVLDGPVPENSYIIDPAITYSTYDTGAVEDGTIRVTRDSSGNIYVVGYTVISGSPGPVQVAARITKFAPKGLEWETLIDGSGADIALGIAISPDNNFLGVVGITTSTDLFDSMIASSNPPITFDTDLTGNEDAFVLRMRAADPDGTGSASGGDIDFATYFGGNELTCPQNTPDITHCPSEGAQGIAFDPVFRGGPDNGNSNLIIAGFTNAPDLPTTANAFQANLASSPPDAGKRDAFAAKLAPDFGGPVANKLRFSSYFGGAEDEFIDVLARTDAVGNYWVAGMTSGTVPTTTGAIQSTNAGGYDLFAARFQSGTMNLTHSTMLGGSGRDTLTDLEVYADTAALMSQTDSPDVTTSSDAVQPGHGGGDDAYAAQITASTNSAATALQYGTYLGGPQEDLGRGIAVAEAGTPAEKVVLVGGAGPGFPAVSQMPGVICGRTGKDVFVTVIDKSGTAPIISHSTCIPGSADERAEDVNVSGPTGSEEIVVVGPTSSDDYPTDKGTPGGSWGTYEEFHSIKSSSHGWISSFVTVYDLDASVVPGTYIAFASNRMPAPPPDSISPSSAIWKVSPAGTDLGPITPLDSMLEPGEDSQPAISPNGQRIAYVSNRNAESTADLYVVSKHGPDYYQCRLTNDSREERRPAWSPDGQMIAFSSDGDGSGPANREIHLARVFQAGPPCLTLTTFNRSVATSMAPAEADAPTFSPDSRCLLFMAGNGFSTNLQIAQVPFADGPCMWPAGPVTSDSAFNSYPAWSNPSPGFPYGRIAFGSLRLAGSETEPPDDVRLFVFDAADLPVTAPPLISSGSLSGPLISFGPPHTGTSSPAWSPDGAKLLAYGSDHPDGDFDIWIVNPDNASENANLLEDLAGLGTEYNTKDWWPAYGIGAP